MPSDSVKRQGREESLRPIRVLACPNAFKGSLTAAQAARAIAEGLARVPLLGDSERACFETVCLPLADGGDGTLETLVEATGGEIFRRQVRGPLSRLVEAAWGRLGSDQRDTAVIEMAQASGLRLLTPTQYAPENTTTFGTGELMRAALDAGCRKLIVGIGGSATNDGGAGMAQALGARLLDAQGQELPPGGAALLHLARVEMDSFCLPPETEVIVACDVDNPLCGAEGASAIYGPQKGATPEQVARLDAALAHYAGILRSQLGADVAEIPGAGAAGGLGAGLLAFCKAVLRPGTEMALDVTQFDAKLRKCDLAVTGEGQLDTQTARGKVIAGVARRAKTPGVPVIALAGSLGKGAEARLREEGLSAALSIVNGPLPLEEALQDAYRLLADATERLGYLLRLRLE